MKKLILVFLVVGSVFADNAQLFNEYYQYGKQNNTNMGINKNSTIQNYSSSHNLSESNYAATANQGTNGSKEMYSGGSNSPSYLHDKGIADLNQCKNQNDPRCQIYTKYSDKDTQADLQAYSHNPSQQYWIHSRPDPNNSNCSLVTTKKPINETTKTCISSGSTQSSCEAKAIVTINRKNYECNPNGGGCNQYINNKYCTKIKDYAPARCISWNYDAPGTHLKNRICKTNRNTGHCVAGQQVGYRIDCKHGFDSGLCGVDKNINWTCTNYQPEELAVYSCKEPAYSYADGCQGKI
jgi:hypothetical protein